MNSPVIAVFASGSGTNAEAIFKHFEKHPAIRIGMLLSNNPHAYVLERANKFSIPSQVFSREQWKDESVVLGWLEEKKITHIVLAGFLWLVPAYLIKAYSGKIINIHPALLPAYGGKGMYGMKVHEAVKQSGDKQSGITIHDVNEKYDEGKIIFQAKCDIDESDTAEKIAEKIHLLEHANYPNVIDAWITQADPKK